MNQKQKIIISYYRGKKSQRRIAREVGLNRRTVARYIKDYDQKRAQLLATADNSQKEELTADIIQAPGYDASSRKKMKLTEEIMDRIHYYLKENQQRKKRGNTSSKGKRLISLRHCKKKNLLSAIPPSVTPSERFNGNPEPQIVFYYYSLI